MVDSLLPIIPTLAPIEGIDLSLSGFDGEELKKLLKNLDAALEAAESE